MREAKLGTAVTREIDIAAPGFLSTVDHSWMLQRVLFFFFRKSNRAETQNMSETGILRANFATVSQALGSLRLPHRLVCRLVHHHFFQAVTAPTLGTLSVYLLPSVVTPSRHNDTSDPSPA